MCRCALCVATGIGYDDEKTLLQKFEHVIKIHQSLKPEYQAVISEITKRMADGTHSLPAAMGEMHSDGVSIGLNLCCACSLGSWSPWLLV
jgi:hypothetical protein